MPQIDEESPVPKKDEPLYPEGGLQAWLVVLGSFLATMVGLGTVGTIGVFHSYLSANQLKEYTESNIGWIFSVYVFFAFFCGIQIGPIFDVHGPRALILAGALCMSGSMMLLGICTHYWHFMLVFGILCGLGTSLVFTPAFAAIGHFFSEKRGKATGIAATGGALGGVVFPLMLRKLFVELGFAWATRITGLLYVATTGAAVLLIRSRQIHHKAGQSILPKLDILKDDAYLSATLGVYFMEWALFVPIAYLPTFAASTGVLSLTFSYNLIAIMNAGSCVGRSGSGYLADRFGRFNYMIATLSLCAATTLGLWLPVAMHDGLAASPVAVRAVLITFAIVFGFASGANISLSPVCIGQLCDTSAYGRYYATCYTIVSFGTLTGIPIAGALIQAAGGKYWGVVLWTFVCYIVSLGCFLWSRVCQVGWRLNAKI